MRANPAFDTEKAIQELGTGEALISFLDVKGSPFSGGAGDGDRALFANGAGDGR